MKEFENDQAPDRLSKLVEATKECLGFDLLTLPVACVSAFDKALAEIYAAEQSDWKALAQRNVKAHAESIEDLRAFYFAAKSRGADLRHIATAITEGRVIITDYEARIEELEAELAARDEAPATDLSELLAWHQRQADQATATYHEAIGSAQSGRMSMRDSHGAFARARRAERDAKHHRRFVEMLKDAPEPADRSEGSETVAAINNMTPDHLVQLRAGRDAAIAGHGIRIGNLSRAERRALRRPEDDAGGEQ